MKTLNRILSTALEHSFELVVSAIIFALVVFCTWVALADTECRVVPGSQCVSCTSGPTHELRCPAVVVDSLD